MSKCDHCKARLEWPVRVDPDTGVRCQLPPCDAEPVWAVADEAGPEIGFEPRSLRAFRGRVIETAEVAETYWRQTPQTPAGERILRIWRLHRCPQGQAAREASARAVEEQRREAGVRHDPALW